MNVLDIVLTILIAALLFGAARMARGRKGGCHGSGSGCCGDCASCEACGRKGANKKEE